MRSWDLESHVESNQESQEHRHRLDTVVVVIRLNEHGNRVAGKEVRYREADGPTNDICQDSVDNELEFSDGENILVHDQNRRLDEAEADDRYHIERKFGLHWY